MPTKLSKEVLKSVEKLGFDHIWTNGQGFLCYVHPDDPEQVEVIVNPSINNEQVARNKIRQCKKIAGEVPQIVKRKGQQVKERQAAERDRALKRIEWAEAKKARLIAEKAEEEHLRKIDELIELRRQELLALHREMSDSPQGNAHRGRGRVEYQGSARDRTPL